MSVTSKLRLRLACLLCCQVRSSIRSFPKQKFLNEQTILKLSFVKRFSNIIIHFCGKPEREHRRDVDIDGMTKQP
jgi:hypothetical protein